MRERPLGVLHSISPGGQGCIHLSSPFKDWVVCIMDIYIYMFIRYIHFRHILRYIHKDYRHIHIYKNMSRTGKRKERPRERGSIRGLQSGSAETSSVVALCIWQVECQERNVEGGMLRCQGEGCGMIMVHASQICCCQRVNNIKWQFISIQKLTLRRSRHIFSQYTSLLTQLAFTPFLWPQVPELPVKSFIGFIRFCKNLEQNFALFFMIVPTCNTDHQKLPPLRIP